MCSVSDSLVLLCNDKIKYDEKGDGKQALQPDLETFHSKANVYLSDYTLNLNILTYSDYSGFLGWKR